MEDADVAPFKPVVCKTDPNLQPRACQNCGLYTAFLKAMLSVPFASEDQTEFLCKRGSAQGTASSCPRADYIRVNLDPVNEVRLE